MSMPPMMRNVRIQGAFRIPIFRTYAHRMMPAMVTAAIP